MQYLIGFDLGTSSCKAVIIDEQARIVASSGHEYFTLYKESDGAEQEAAQWWQSFRAAVQDCIAQTQGKVEARDIAAVGISAMSSAVVPVDNSGRELRNAMLWLDRRAKSQCEKMNQTAGRKIFEICGNRGDPSAFGAKLLWIKENEPELYAKTWQFLHANSYLVFKLTGVPTQDDTENGLSMLADVRKGTWSNELLSLFGIDRAKLPEIFSACTAVGTITKEAARECGLCEGTVVIAGAMDALASSAGLGAAAEGDVSIVGGTVINVGMVRSTPDTHPLLYMHRHLVPGKYLTVSSVDFGGGTLRWYRNVEGLTGYEEIETLARQAPPGNDGLIFLPYMVGQRTPLYNDNTTGLVFGLTPAHERKHLFRMFMEGSAYAIRNVIRHFKNTGITPFNAVMTGGITNSPVWTQIVADILEIPIHVPASTDAACFGSAIAAGIAAGIIPNFESAVKTADARTYTPDSTTRQSYRHNFEVFLKLLEKNMPVFDFARGAPVVQSGR